jgi:hypothetical protein
LNPGKEVINIDHVAEVNKDIVSLDSSVNMNLWALNEEMGYDVKTKEKIPVEEKRVGNGKLINPKHFITLPYMAEKSFDQSTIFQRVRNLIY